MKFRRLFPIVLLLAFVLPAQAWGPHPKITQSAMDTLGPNDPLMLKLGSNAPRLTSFCWMGDWRGGLKVEPDGSSFYTDDHLLHQGQPRYSSHSWTGAEPSLELYFRRAVQALQTETPANAARWIGALLHFTEDAGAPPHALTGMGAAHGPMENWVQQDKIVIGDYKPQLLGSTVDEALAGYLARMKGLIAYSRERGEKVHPLVLANDHPASEPIILESALESSRVVADLLYTLGHINLPPVESATTLKGTVYLGLSSSSGPVLAKVILLGTDYSTLTDPSGGYEFHNLPPGKYEGRVLCTGHVTGKFKADLSGGDAKTLNLPLIMQIPYNLVRNSNFSLRWISPDRPDSWYPVKDGWASDIIPVAAGQKYRLSARWKPESKAHILIRWYSGMTANIARQVNTTEVPSGESAIVLTTPENARTAQVVIYTPGQPADACERIAFTREVN